jgi:predicted nucleic acid-binding protein
MITAVDTNVLIDILEPDPVHGVRSKEALKKCLREGAVAACEVVWAEVAAAYGDNPNGVVEALRALRVGFSAMSLEAALTAAEAWHHYRRRGGGRDRIAADFLIGGHASVQCERLLTRDRGFYRKYFKNLAVIPAGRDG